MKEELIHIALPIVTFVIGLAVGMLAVSEIDKDINRRIK